MPTVTGRPHPPTGGPPTRARPRPPPRRRTGRGPARARPPRARRDSGSRGGARREARRTGRSTPRATPWPSRLTATRPDVEHPAEEARKAARVVDLVRVVRASRGHDPNVGPGLLGLDLRDRVRHREDDRVAVHSLDVLERDDARAREADEDVGAL